MTEVTDHGQIKRLVLTDDWRELATAGNGAHGPTLREYQFLENKNIKLCLYYRGNPLSTESGDSFKQILNEPAHFLNMEEVAGLAEVLEDACNLELFDPSSIQTADAGGRRVLVVEGRWIQQSWNTYSLYVNCDESGSIVQQIYFLAPVTEYPGLLPNVKLSLDSIEWAENQAGQ